MLAKIWLLLIWVAVFAIPTVALADETGRLQNAMAVVRALRAAPDGGIPESCGATLTAWP